MTLQVGEDSGLQFAMANADLISALHPFRGSCKPEWLFIIAGLFLQRELFVHLLVLFQEKL